MKMLWYDDQEPDLARRLGLAFYLENLMIGDQ